MRNMHLLALKANMLGRCRMSTPVEESLGAEYAPAGFLIGLADAGGALRHCSLQATHGSQLQQKPYLHMLGRHLRSTIEHQMA